MGSNDFDYGFRKPKEIYLPHRIAIRITEEEFKTMKQEVARDPETWNSNSDFIRGALAYYIRTKPYLKKGDENGLCRKKG